MHVLGALLDANVSLMDEESFIYHLVSPFDQYPRSLGIEMDERIVGTCNATLVKAENKPVRCDYFEHYKVSSQSYSSAAAPFLHEDGRFGGALLINSPLAQLPDQAPTMASVAARMILRLYNLDGRMWQALASVEFFSPLLQLSDYGIALLSKSGAVLTMNDTLGNLCPGWSTREYATFPFGKYLVGGEKSLSSAIQSATSSQQRVSFKSKKGQEPIEAEVVLCKTVDLAQVQEIKLLAFRLEKQGAHAANENTPNKVSDSPNRPKQSYIGQSKSWREADEAVRRIAPLKVNVLLLGETGTGKEVMARAIHEYSGRKGPFVAVNCGAIPRDLMASELFGYAPGAFTGAQAKGFMGKFEYANGGTIFLDEIGDMPYDMQVGLLRVLQEQTIVRLGSNESHPLDVRFIAATNQNLKDRIEEKQFRLDLYHRLSQIEIRLPPLRERTGDIPLFLDAFNREICDELRLPYSPFSESTIEEFERCEWPGNVRELRNIVERCLIFCGQGCEVLPSDVLKQSNSRIIV